MTAQAVPQHTAHPSPVERFAELRSAAWEWLTPPRLIGVVCALFVAFSAVTIIGAQAIAASQVAEESVSRQAIDVTSCNRGNVGRAVDYLNAPSAAARRLVLAVEPLIDCACAAAGDVHPMTSTEARAFIAIVAKAGR